jgi:hypothetical protein
MPSEKQTAFASPSAIPQFHSGLTPLASFLTPLASLLTPQACLKPVL